MAPLVEADPNQDVLLMMYGYGLKGKAAATPFHTDDRKNLW
jgi:hypothetical protein